VEVVPGTKSSLFSLSPQSSLKKMGLHKEYQQLYSKSHWRLLSFIALHPFRDDALSCLRCHILTALTFVSVSFTTEPSTPASTSMVLAHPTLYFSGFHKHPSIMSFSLKYISNHLRARVFKI